MIQTREAVKCTCCGREVMAEIVGGKMVVRKRIHGVVHLLLTELPKECNTENQTIK